MVLRLFRTRLQAWMSCAWVGLIVLGCLLGDATLLAQGDPVSRMADRVAVIAEYAVIAVAIIVLIVAAVSAAGGSRNGLMEVGGAIIFLVLAINARAVVSLLRF